MGVTPGHREELQRSGLSDETIAAAELYSATAAGTREVLGYGAGPGLVFPYPTLNGSAPYSRVKLDKADPEGKRYRSPARQPNRLYVPSILDRALLQDASTPLWLTEGEKKALKACQEGLACLALPGVWSWRTRDDRDRSVPIPDLDLIVWRGRTAFVVFDSDLTSKRPVRLAEWALARELQQRGARVLAIRLPGGPNGAKVGLDDYLLEHSVETLCGLEPVAILDPATVAGDPVYVRHGDEHVVSWPAHDVTLTVSGLREHSDGVSAEVAVALAGVEVHWSKVNLSSTVSREGLVKRLTASAPRIPWGAIVERTCRQCVQAARAGLPAVVVVPRLRSGPRYLLDPVLPFGETTILFADGGQGKGHLAVSLALGAMNAGTLAGGIRADRQTPVLYCDWEAGQEEIEERLYLLGRGLGWPVEGRLHYRSMSRGFAEEAPAIRTEVSRLGVGLVIIDSLTPAAGPEPEGADAAARTMNALRSLGPTVTRLVIAHMTHLSAQQRAGGARPFGSVFYWNLARSVWELRKSEDTEDLVVGLYHRKVNSGRLRAPLGLRFAFTAEAIQVHAADLGESPDLLARASLPQRLRTQLRSGAQTTAQLAEGLEAPEATVARAARRLATHGTILNLAGAGGRGHAALWALPAGAGGAR